MLIVLAAAAGAAWRAVQSLDRPLNVAAPLRFKVPAGARFARVAADLGRQGVVPQPRVWVLYARWKGVAAEIKAGEYEIEPGTTARGLLDKMVSGQVVLHSLTIVDGWRLQEVFDAMRRNPDIVITLPARPPADLLRELGVAGVGPATGGAGAGPAGAAQTVAAQTVAAHTVAGGASAEGEFLPETYRFTSGATDVDLLRQAHAALQRALDSAWARHDPTLPVQNAYELLIMASIVEKESGVPVELPKIAGLYWHRLAIGMRLQADPTLIYGLGDAYDGDLHTVDLRTDGPYNTYTRVGLPPTPIALPGAAALEATARPEKTDALYFVASAKGDGTHVFSATLEEHNAAVAQYLKRPRQPAAAGAR
jgi:UPF0755 protein